MMPCRAISSGSTALRSGSSMDAFTTPRSLKRVEFEARVQYLADGATGASAVQPVGCVRVHGVRVNTYSEAGGFVQTRTATVDVRRCPFACGGWHVAARLPI